MRVAHASCGAPQLLREHVPAGLRAVPRWSALRPTAPTACGCVSVAQWVRRLALTPKRASPLASLAALARLAALRIEWPPPQPPHAHTTNTQPPPLRGLPRAHSTPPIAAAEGEAKVNFWENPSDPQSWKEEQFVLTILAAWGVVIYGGMSAFGGGKKDAAPAAVEPTEADGDLEKFMAELEAAEKK